MHGNGRSSAAKAVWKSSASAEGLSSGTEQQRKPVGGRYLIFKGSELGFSEALHRYWRRATCRALAIYESNLGMDGALASRRRPSRGERRPDRDHLRRRTHAPPAGITPRSGRRVAATRLTKKSTREGEGSVLPVPGSDVETPRQQAASRHLSICRQEA